MGDWAHHVHSALQPLFSYHLDKQLSLWSSTTCMQGTLDHQLLPQMGICRAPCSTGGSWFEGGGGGGGFEGEDVYVGSAARAAWQTWSVERV